MTEKGFVEKRKSTRLKASLRMEVEYPKGSDRIFLTETINLSDAGIYCNLHRKFPVMTKLFCTLLIPLHDEDSDDGVFPYRRVQCETIVVRTAECGQFCETALFITDISNNGRRAIRSFIDKVTRNGNEGNRSAIIVE
jgi:hypothetical protein